MKKILLVFFIAAMFSTSAFAVTPLKLSLWQTISAPSDKDVRGVALGIGSNFRQINGFSFNCIYSKIETVYGVQLGAVNVATSVRGLQMGFVNITDTMHGIQLGIVNIINKSPALPVMIIFNCQF
ncbi:MAG: hypothetical protein LBQ37_04250 [Elusimicrobiota bacterium]|jgi:hypothetical protein|nr:hypothetical protein [Elusimicrobiota bacterium]